MTKIKAIVQDVINGCTANNADETKMNFNINYYVNHAMGSGTKHHCFVYKVGDLEENLYNIIRDNISKDRDVVITDITIRIRDEIVRVNNNNYAYSLSSLMNWISSDIK